MRKRFGCALALCLSAQACSTAPQRTPGDGLPAPARWAAQAQAQATA